MPTSDFSPQAGSGGGNVTTDANLELQFGDSTFAAIHGASGSGYVVSANARSVLRGSPTSNQFDFFGRYCATFDTSALTAGAIITSATMALYGGGTKQNGLAGDFDIHVSAFSPAANNVIVATDFGSKGATSFGSIAYGSWNASGWNTITLNAAGLAAISKTGITRLMCRFGDDMNGSFTGAWGNGATSQVNWNAAEGANPPVLSVTYSAAAGGSGILMAGAGL